MKAVVVPTPLKWAMALCLAIAASAALLFALTAGGYTANAQTGATPTGTSTSDATPGQPTPTDPTPTDPTPTQEALPPVFVWETSIPEDWPKGQEDHIITTFEAYPADNADENPLTFEMVESDDAEKFLLIDANRDENSVNYVAHLILKEEQKLDYEEQDTYIIGVMISTEAGATTEVQLRLKITEVTDEEPSPTPSATPVMLFDSCIEAISGNVNIVRTWDDECLSGNRPASGAGQGDYYARFITFTLEEPASVTISLTSEVDTYMYLMKGEGRDGQIETENDDIVRYQDLNSGVEDYSLQAGTYTIEATTFEAEKSAAFRLTVSGLPGDGLPVTTCSSGIAVEDPMDNPGLVLDCEVLLSLRDTLTGSALLNWSPILPIGNWAGVTVSGEAKRVTRLELDDLELNGNLPSELGALTALQRLSLDNNRLRGGIPTELGALTALTELSLANNSLTGEIPAELGDLSELTTLRLNANSLRGAIPTELGSLTNLQVLSLANNSLTGEIPAELGNLTNLQTLKLAVGNRFNGCIPAALQGVSDNDLSGLAIDFCASGVCITGSAVENPADNPGLVSDCNALLAARDRLAGRTRLNWSVAIPMENWEGITVGGSSKRVGTLALGNRALSGRLPAELGRLSHLTLLHLPGNELSGPIPAELGNLKNLSIMQLPDNKLSGSLPPDLADLANLTFVDLSHNNLSGDIPPELSSLSNLSTLHLDNNQLSGAIPPKLGSLPNLRNLHLDNNQLSGDIPPELGDIDTLEKLELAGNELEGKIPPELGSLSALEILDLSSNNLKGEIPTELGSLSNLEALSLSANELGGEIPAQLGALPKLRRLSLHSNPFTGCIPKELQDVQANDLLGLRLPFCGEGKCAGGTAVPNPNDNHGLVADCHALISAQDMLKGSASLNWSADLAIGQWNGVVVSSSPSRVTELNLSDKELDGKISTELGNITHLKTLNLSDNELTGEIPSELAKLARLEELLLANNSLSGNIPGDLTRIASLKTLKLAGNSISGCIPDGLADDVMDDDLDSLRLPDCGKVDCSTGIAVESPENNAALVQECKTLLDLRDTLAGSVFLNWSVHRAMDDWDGIKTGITTGGSTKRVTEIELADESLNGEIPPALSRLVGLQVLNLSNNELSGRIPSELGRLANLQRLLLNNNRLIGIISPELSVLTLTELKLSGNSLTGCIPAKLKNVATNDLSMLLGLTDCTASVCVGGSAVENQDANPGLLADCGALLDAMDILKGTGGFLNWNKDVAINNWDGVSLSGSPSRVTALRIGRNRLRGELSPHLGKLSKLETLALSGNRLNGAIPAELGNLVELEYLSLSDNRLSGVIPVELGGLTTNLEYLYLGGNGLIGCIPAALREVEHNDLARLGLVDCAP